ncbi:MAG: thiamine phosphate synthase [Bacteroidia bacterium]
MRAVWEAMAVTPWQVEDLDRWTQQAVARGATAVVLRLAHPPAGEALWEWARRWEGLPWLVHARWATQPMGWGMHFPAPPLPPGPKPHPTYLWGQSCHSLKEVGQAAPWASYVWLSGFFPTPSHPGHPPRFDLKDLAEICQRYAPLPIVVIGGVTTQAQIELIRQAGAAGFAAIRYFL